MAYDERLAARVRAVLDARDAVSERRMFGGIAFMVGGNMACGVVDDDLMLRLDPDDAERALAEAHVRPMDFTGRPLRGFVYVAPDGTADDGQLASWVDMAAGHAASLPAK